MLLEVLSEHWNTRVTIVDSGLSALAAIEQQHFDIVLSDINMPEMNGIDLMLLIKEKNPEVPVIAFTATAQPETLDKFLSMGFDDYLLKPFKEADLLTKIAKYASFTYKEDTLTSPPAVHSKSVDTPVVYSLSALRTITRGNTKKLIDILEFILTRCPIEVNELSDAAAYQRWPEVASRAHKLRSSFGQIEANTLVQDLHNIELEALEADDDSPDVNRAVQLFTVQAQAVFVKLRQEIRAMEAVA